MKIGKQTIGIMGLVLFSPLLLAEEIICCEEDFIKPVVALTGGMAINSDAGGSKSFPIGFSQLDYDADHDTQTRGVFGGFIGAELPLRQIWSLQMGLAYYQTSPFAAEGTLAQGFNPQTTADYDYSYKIRSRQLLVESKLLLEWHDRFHPYVSVGLGVGFNEAKDFDVDYDPSLAITPLYKSHTETSFTYNLGLGLDYDIMENWRFGIGYRFTDLGKAKLGRGDYDIFDPTPISETLEQSHLYTQEVIAQITFVM